jgi:hypothetical protein
MATGAGVDFTYAQYTADDGTTWSVRVLNEWAADGDSGLGAFDAADPVWPTSPRMKTRKAVLQDLVSGRRTTRIAGTTTADCLTRGNTTVTFARGAAGSYTLTTIGTQPEKRPGAATITHKPEPITT